MRLRDRCTGVGSLSEDLSLKSRDKGGKELKEWAYRSEHDTSIRDINAVFPETLSSRGTCFQPLVSTNMTIQDIGNHLNSKISRPVSYVVTATLSVALYNVLELTFILFLTFKRRSGLYFWSFFVATWGIPFYATGFILKDLIYANPYLSISLIVTGWYAMVTGQSMVLYSRLHLVVHRQNIFRFVLGMIIFNVIVLHIPITILAYGSNSPQYTHFYIIYAVYEKIQVTMFSIQESIISGIYVYETCKMLRFEFTLDTARQSTTRRLMVHLIYMIIIVALLDISILGLEYAGQYTAQTSVKALVYSVKLKLEFDILNRLADLVRRPGDRLFISGSGTTWREGHGGPESGNQLAPHSSRSSFWSVFVGRVHRGYSGCS